MSSAKKRDNDIYTPMSMNLRLLKCVSLSARVQYCPVMFLFCPTQHLWVMLYMADAMLCSGDPCIDSNPRRSASLFCFFLGWKEHESDS